MSIRCSTVYSICASLSGVASGILYKEGFEGESSPIALVPASMFLCSSLLFAYGAHRVNTANERKLLDKIASLKHEIDKPKRKRKVNDFTVDISKL
jgi:hypothetical protein